MIRPTYAATPAGNVPVSPSSLSRTRLWKSGLLSHEEQEAIEKAVSPAKSVSGNIDLVREGERADALFIITDGWACRCMSTREGGRQIPTLLLPGDVANLDSLMFDQLDYGVRTITEVTTVSLPQDRALALAAQHPGIARAFTWLGLIENVTLSKWALSLGRRSAIERVAHLLCELSVRLGRSSDGKSSFDFPLTQEQIADALGLTSVHVNRMLGQLRIDNLITSVNRIMTIPDVAKLGRFGGFDPRYLHIAPPANTRSTVS
jgi:CRP-like cAMP-binding protein